VRFDWIQQHVNEFEVQAMCRVLGVSRAGYYAWLKRPVSERARANTALDKRITKIFAKSRETYGSPRVFNALRKQSVPCGENRVARRMRKNALISVRRRKFKPQGTDSNHDLPIAKNLLEQRFEATQPNQRWVGDITYIWTAQGWLYLAAIIDLFSRRVVGWATSAYPDAELVCRALEMAVVRRGRPQDLVYHSDRGVQYASSKFRQTLALFHITPSMSRRGNCYDNAVAESFFDTLKVELVHRYKFANRAIARMLLIDYIEEFYNNNRIHSTLGFFSPAEYETLMASPSQNRVH
jgi:transposase InsO family protein